MVVVRRAQRAPCRDSQQRQFRRSSRSPSAPTFDRHEISRRVPPRDSPDFSVPRRVFFARRPIVRIIRPMWTHSYGCIPDGPRVPLAAVDSQPTVNRATRRDSPRRRGNCRSCNEGPPRRHATTSQPACYTREPALHLPDWTRPGRKRVMCAVAA